MTTKARIARRTVAIAAGVSLALGAAAAVAGARGSGAEFPTLAPTPYPMQHVNPREADYVEGPAPSKVAPAWRALDDSMIAQPCSSAPSSAKVLYRGPNIFESSSAATP